MKPFIDEIWNTIEVGANLICTKDSDVCFDESKKKIFGESCEIMYHELLEYMEDKEKPLDRHKIAAIIMISAIRAEVLQGKRKNDIFVANYVLAAEVGFSYMREALNRELEKKSGTAIEPINNFFFPKANSCSTDYFRIFYRNLYFADTNKAWNLNPLDIAERLFLLEYMTLEHNGIDPNILKEYE